mmetsp:Transcript_10996/g.15240  ORF Transcript_10996/g.15240 Transcript_10996/m.15240 type:complete len:167 (+) Transcript_10996:47-547(+)
MRRQLNTTAKRFHPTKRGLFEIKGEILSEIVSGEIGDALISSIRENKVIQRNLTRHLSIGVNSVLRNLEKGNLSLIILAKIKRDSFLRPLRILACVKKVPVCLVTMSSSKLGNCIGLRSATSLGFKSEILDGTGRNPLDSLIEELHKHSGILCDSRLKCDETSHPR